MISNTCPSNLTLIDAHVKAMWLHRQLKRAQTKLDGCHKINQRCRIKFLDAWNMLKWNDHQMTVVVGENIKHDKAVLAAIEDIMLLVMPISGFGAENAPLLLAPGVNIGHAPGRPEVFHALSISQSHRIGIAAGSYVILLYTIVFFCIKLMSYQLERP